MKKIIVFAALLLGMTSVCFAQKYYDVLYLKDGNVVKGEIISQIYGESLTLKTIDGKTITFKSHDIEKQGQEKKSTTTAFIKPVGAYESLELSLGPISQISGMIGYRFSPLLEVGCGVGIATEFYYYDYYDKSDWGLPIFGHISSNVCPNFRISPYLYCNAGYMFSLDANNAFTNGNMYLEAAAGISFNLSNHNRMYVVVGGYFTKYYTTLLEMKTGITF